MQKSATPARQKAKTLLLVMSVATTISGWAVISVKHPPAVPAQQAQSLFGSRQILLSLVQPTRPLPVAVTRSSH